MGIKIAIYSRKSKFTGKGDSVQNQVEMCKKYIDNNFDENQIDRIDIYEDEGFSGKNLDRPEFKKFMEVENKKPYDYLIVYRLDRISRNVGDFSKLLDKLSALQTEFISISEKNFDTTTPIGRAMIYIASTFSQLERETIAERIKDNMYMLAKQGKWTGGTTPLGYKSIKRFDGTHSYYTLQLDKGSEELKTAKLIFSKYSEYQSINKVVQYLYDNGIKTRKGADYHQKTVKRILTNPIYCIADKDAYNYFVDLGSSVCFTLDDVNNNSTTQYGILPYNRNNQSRGKLIINPPEKWLITVSQHQGIVTGKEFVRIQKMIDDAKGWGGSSTGKHSLNEYSILSGVLKCKCGDYMRPKKNPSGNYYYYCITKMRTHKKECDNTNVNVQQIDDSVLQLIFDYKVDGNPICEQLKLLQQKANNLDNDIYSEVKEVEKKIKANEIKAKTLTNIMLDEIAKSENPKNTQQFYTKQIDDLIVTNSRLEKRMEELKNKEQVQNDMHYKIKNIVDSIEFIKNNFNKISIAQKREFIKTIVNKVVWDGKNLNIFINGISAE